MQMLGSMDTSNPLTMMMLMGGGGNLDPLTMAAIMDQDASDDTIQTVLLSKAFSQASNPNMGFRALDGADNSTNTNTTAPRMKFFGVNKKFVAGKKSENTTATNSTKKTSTFVPPAGFLSSVADTQDANDRVFVQKSNQTKDANFTAKDRVFVKYPVQPTPNYAVAAPIRNGVGLPQLATVQAATPIQDQQSQLLMDLMLLKAMGVVSGGITNSKSTTTKSTVTGSACFCDSKCGTLGDCCNDFHDICASNPKSSILGGASSITNPILLNYLAGSNMDPTTLMMMGVDPATALLVQQAQKPQQPQQRPASATSCMNRCGSKHLVSTSQILLQCGCDNSCRAVGVCCSDFLVTCG